MAQQSRPNATSNRGGGISAAARLRVANFTIGATPFAQVVCNELEALLKDVRSQNLSDARVEQRHARLTPMPAAEKDALWSTAGAATRTRIDNLFEQLAALRPDARINGGKGANEAPLRQHTLYTRALNALHEFDNGAGSRAALDKCVETYLEAYPDDGQPQSWRSQYLEREVAERKVGDVYV